MHKQDFDCKGGSMKGMKVGQDMTSGFVQPEDRQGWRHGGDVGPHFKAFSAMLMILNLTTVMANGEPLGFRRGE